MASAVIHLCVAKKINEYLKMDEKLLLLGAIAPDISKLVNQPKYISHFLDGTDEDGIPNTERFLSKYASELNKPFEMGYYIHLLTDKYWFRDYIYKFINRYGQAEEEKDLTYTGIKNLIYRDYTNLNIDLIDEYEIALDLFSNEFTYPKSVISEIPMDKIDILIEKMGLIIIESKKGKKIVFDLIDINLFINDCTQKIINEIKRLELK
ncbi:MAG TPA: hypothetical protein PK737_02075 [Bacilli bacterium]|nr:hypothetical protein [Bacilli bacterium]